MRSFLPAQVVTLCSAALLVACTDGTVAPLSKPLSGVSISPGSCGAVRPERQSLTTPPSLAPVTITATYSGGGLPWNVMQQMQFPLNYGADQAPCMNTPSMTFIAETLYVAAHDTVPRPDGVDPGFWDSLSARERRVLVAKALEYMRQYPDKYPTVGSAINSIFADMILRTKANAKVRANDFYGLNPDGELFAGGVYGCLLYQRFARDPDWFLSNNETLAFVIDLVTAFAESEFATSPLRGLRFGANGVFGAAMAKADGYGLDCGSMIFQSIPGGRIIVTDPYADGRPSQPGPSSPPPAPQPPPGGLPIDWYDQ
jgi:hypothetical protein